MAQLLTMNQTDIYEWITKADADSKGQGFQAYVKVNEGC